MKVYRATLASLTKVDTNFLPVEFNSILFTAISWERYVQYGVQRPVVDR